MTTNQATQKKPNSISRVVLYVAVGAAMLATLMSAGLVSRPPEPATAYAPRDIIGMVHDELGDAWQRDIPRVQGVMVNASPAGYVVQVRFAVNDQGADTRAGARADVQRLMAALYQAPVALVQVEGTLPVADPNGFVRETHVLTCALGRTAAEQINWDKVDAAGLFQAMDSLWWHPSLAD